MFDQLVERLSNNAYMKRDKRLEEALFQIFYNTRDSASVIESHQLIFNKSAPPVIGINETFSRLSNDDLILKLSLSQSSYNLGNTTNKKRRKTVDDIDESTLIRDLIFVVQGIDGEYVKYNEALDAFTLDESKYKLQRSSKIIISKISELGWVFRNIRSFIEQSKSIDGGLYEQSFKEGITTEVRDYYRMIAVLETEMALEVTATKGLTLRRLEIWASRQLRRLKWLLSLIEFQSHSINEANVHRLKKLTYVKLHGDPSIKNIGLNVEQFTSRPLIKMIENWVFHGILNDPHNEFFVQKNTQVVKSKVIHEIGKTARFDHNHWVWKDQFIISTDKIPSSIPLALAQDILVIGKTLNFLKDVCHDSNWILTTLGSLYQAKENRSSFNHLNEVIQHIKPIIAKRLVDLVVNEYKIVEHCDAIRNYQFLSHADLVSSLLSTFKGELDQPANKIYKHVVNNLIETSIKSSTATIWDFDIQRRCTAYLPDSDKLNGWEGIVLHYVSDPCLDPIIGSETIVKDREEIFTFLWKLKIVSNNVTDTYRKMMYIHKENDISLVKDYLHQCYVTKRHMSYLIACVQHYVIYDVLEVQWLGFIERMKKALSIDQLIEAYALYILKIKKHLSLGCDADPLSLYSLILKSFQAIMSFDEVCFAFVEDIQAISNQLNMVDETWSKDISEKKVLLKRLDTTIWPRLRAAQKQFHEVYETLSEKHKYIINTGYV